ncbi:hypothetical protein HFN_2112 [Helicobacter fennelliae MRY12-0050]|uniref:Uncharacterized protein n=1 Tax=Helicobacter fennelliae MRY12-0050 TaxID=1325130 RepID=T1CXN2_9HELI|nr:hypothetical protein HFN_2112 [Helicobacter fennelliae MRY12-0050]
MLNNCEFTLSEWERFFSFVLAKKSDHIEDKAISRTKTISKILLLMMAR